jgi:hypothetical protein
MRTNAPIAAWVVGVSGLASLGPSLPSIAQLPPTPSSAAASSPVSPSSAVRPPVTIKCPNGRQYRLTTGSGVGACKVYVDHGRVIGGFCTDGAMARQACSTGCLEITGSGTCEQHNPDAAGNDSWRGG